MPSTDDPVPADNSARAYPAWLEDWWMAQACRHVGATVEQAESALPKFARAAQELSDLFTVDRPAAAPPEKVHPAGKPRQSAKIQIETIQRRPKKFPDYGADAELALAYGLFFFPPCFVRARLPLAEAIEYRGWNIFADGKINRPARVLDLGAGLGAAGLGAALLLRERGLADEVELTAVDHSPNSLARLTVLARENAAHLPGMTVRTVVADAREWVRNSLSREKDAYDLIVIGFALNEILPATEKLESRLEFMRGLRRTLSEHGLVLILEPALHETANALQELSDAMCGKPADAHNQEKHGRGGRLGEASLPPRPSLCLPRWGPYLSDHRCPLRAEGKYWNHEVRRWNAPASLALFNRQLWREIDALKFSYALHGREAPPALPAEFTAGAHEPGGLIARLVSPLRLQKGGFIAACVASDGVKYTLDLPIRGLPKEEIERLEQIERGDILALRGLKPLGTPRTLRLPTPTAMVARYHVR